MRKFKLMILAVLTIMSVGIELLAAYTPSSTVTYNLADGVVYRKNTYDSLYGGYQEIFILEVDLSNQSLEVGIGICPDNMLKNTQTLGKSYNAIAAVNLGFFDMTGSKPTTAVGLIKARGKVFKGQVGNFSSYTEGYLWVNKDRAGVADPSRFSMGMAENIRFSYPVLVQKGQIYPQLAAVTSDSSGIILSRRSRTALGVSSSRQKMYIVVIDEKNGRRAITCKELADFMISLGCYEALNGDGGGSSTMWTSTYGLMNRPQGGTYQRPVGDILYVRNVQAANMETDTSNPSKPNAGSMNDYTPKGER